MLGHIETLRHEKLTGRTIDSSHSGQKSNPSGFDNCVQSIEHMNALKLNSEAELGIACRVDGFSLEVQDLNTHIRYQPGYGCV